MHTALSSVYNAWIGQFTVHVPRLQSSHPVVCVGTGANCRAPESIRTNRLKSSLIKELCCFPVYSANVWCLRARVVNAALRLAQEPISDVTSNLAV